MLQAFRVNCRQRKQLQEPQNSLRHRPGTNPQFPFLAFQTRSWIIIGQSLGCHHATPAEFGMAQASFRFRHLIRNLIRLNSEDTLEPVEPDIFALGSVIKAPAPFCLSYRRTLLMVPSTYDVKISRPRQCELLSSNRRLSRSFLRQPVGQCLQPRISLALDLLWNEEQRQLATWRGVCPALSWPTPRYPSILARPFLAFTQS